MNGVFKLRMTNDELRIVRVICALLAIIWMATSSINAQSINQSYPTAITSNEISGQIAARDVGDARLTSYFYTFNAVQGDVFINVVTTNLNGDIDIFTADNLRPLSKITIYADAAGGETGRVVYLRQPTKLILRIEGRTPNDDAATFRIKFAGSFAPAEIAADNAESLAPQVKSDNQTDVRVNSVGTIIEIKPKLTAQPKAETVAETKPVKETNERAEAKSPPVEIQNEAKKSDDQTINTKVESTIENQTETSTQANVDEVAKETPKIENAPPDAPETIAETIEPTDSVKKETIAASETVENKPSAAPKTKKAVKPKAVKSLPASALENIRLIVLFKDGTKIERSMSDVLKVGVDKGVLTVISKDGQIGRYSILEVEKMTIE